MACNICTRTLILTSGLLVWLQASTAATTEGIEGFGQVDDCRFLAYEQQQFFDLKLPSFRTDWISPDFIQSALPHTPAKVRSVLMFAAALGRVHEQATKPRVVAESGQMPAECRACIR